MRWRGNTVPGCCSNERELGRQSNHPPSPAAEETEARGHVAGKPREASASWLCWTPLQPPSGTPSKCPRPLWGTGFLACLCPSFLKLAALCSPPAHVHRSVLGASVLVHMKSGWEKGA